MSILRSFVSAFSMFSRLPVPTLKWRGDNMRYMLAMFPFVGAAVGLFLWAWLWISDTLGFGVILRAVGLTLWPVAVTGGIHLDGFCDTTDALSSRAAPERKREILKDPHTGAFAVIGVAAYLLLHVGLAAELQITARTPLLLGLICVLSRTLSGLAVLLFSPSGDQGLGRTFSESASKRLSAAVLLVLLLLSSGGLLLTDLAAGGAVILAALLCFLHLRVMSRRQFGGMSGDLAGYFLQLCEISALAALILTQKVVTQ